MGEGAPGPAAAIVGAAESSRTREWGACRRWGAGGTEPQGESKASSSIVGSEFRIGCTSPGLPRPCPHPGTPEMTQPGAQGWRQGTPDGRRSST